MKPPVLCLAALCLLVSSASAGPNAGGTIIVHNPAIIYCVDTTSWCGQGTPPTSCESANTGIDNASVPVVWKVYAAFANPPRLKGMSFGVHYPSSGVVIIGQGPCIGDLNNGAAEFPGAGWPGNDTGTAIVWQFTQTTTLVESYWFGGYNYYFPNPQLFCLRDNPDPNLGGYFGDDSVPPQLDPIAGYGCLGFNEPGHVVCPAAPGACCRPDGTCFITTQDQCLPPDTWNGGPTCDPNPCQPSTESYFFGGMTQGCPGEQVTVDVDATTSVDIKGYSINFFFDPAVFEFVSQTVTGTRGEGAAITTFSNTDHSVTAGIVFSFSCPPSIPPGTGPMLRVTLQVKADAPMGPTTLHPADNPPALNRMTACDGTTLVPTLNDGTFTVVACQGACCFPDGHCEFTTQANCPTGDWRQGVPCDPNPCQPVPVEESTWGRIKNIYR